MSSVKQQLLAEFNASREDLWKALDVLDESTEIYPGWKKREFLAHIAGWEATVFDVIHRHISGQPPRDDPYPGMDITNARFVAVRQSTTLEDAKLECEINRFAILSLLDRIHDLDEAMHYPWGTETVTEFIHGAIDHERGHLADILKLNPIT